jgi:hypothetical protein
MLFLQGKDCTQITEKRGTLPAMKVIFMRRSPAAV